MDDTEEKQPTDLHDPPVRSKSGEVDLEQIRPFVLDTRGMNGEIEGNLDSST